MARPSAWSAARILGGALRGTKIEDADLGRDGLDEATAAPIREAALFLVAIAGGAGFNALPAGAGWAKERELPEAAAGVGIAAEAAGLEQCAEQLIGGQARAGRPATAHRVA